MLHPSRFARRAAAFACVLCALLLLFPASRAEGDNAPLHGFYETIATIYDRSGGSNKGIGRIPRYTPLVLTMPAEPGHSGYAQVTYDGMTGYVRLYGLLPLPEDKPDPRAGQTMYASDVRVLREQSLHGAQVLRRLPPETPFTVLARTPYMIKVQAGEDTGYIYGGELQALTPDTDMEMALHYAVREQPLLALPLAGADVLENLTQGQLVTVTGRNRGYLRVQAGEETVGYVPRDGAAPIGALKDDVMLVYADAGAPLYMGAGTATGAAGELTRRALYRVLAQAGTFLQVAPSEAFVAASDVQALVLSAFQTPRLASVEEPVAPSLLPDGAGDAPHTLAPERLYTFAAQTGSWWYVDDGLVKGFAPARSLRALPEKADTMNRTWAVLLGDQAFLPGASQPQPVKQGDLVQLAQMLGAWFKTNEGAYVHRSQVRIIGSDAPVTPHTVTAGSGLKLLSLPDSQLGQNMLDIPEGATLNVTGFSRSYLLVTVDGKTGYVPGSTLKTHETRYLPDNETMPPVGILVNRSDFSVSLYAVDESGERIGLPLQTDIAALGKRTTPTPPGKYVLGLKQRWVRFVHTQAPHGITYLPGRYIHGIPSYGQDESRFAQWAVNELGTAASGGCVRLPFDMAAYLYFNCPSYTTQMEVINGAPKTAAAPAAPAASPVPTGTPAPDGT